MNTNIPTKFETLKDSHGNEFFMVDNALIQWTNFSGTETPYNRKGKRNFEWVIPDPELAQQLAALGFNVKHHSVRDGYDGEDYDHMKIEISYETNDGKPISEINREWVPEIYLVDDDDYYTLLTEDSIGELDSRVITYALFEFRPYNWTYNKKTGMSAKLKRMFVKVKKDPIIGRFKGMYTPPVRPNDYSVQRSQDIRANREVDQQVPGGNDLPFNI